ncbi:MAG: hypothetical protein WB566_13865 [Terriglobales bacterium]
MPMPKEEIQNLARSIVADNPGGIRYSDLVRRICQQSPETGKKTVEWAVWDLNKTFPTEVAKPDRGLFTPVSESDSGAVLVGDREQIASTGARVRESEFYEPFAQYLKDDLDECTVALPLGGSTLKAKWATPDVVGTYKPQARDLIRFQVEIISAEIKIASEPVVAFGQAVAYRLFSTKTYIAMPKSLTKEEQDRLKSLCVLFGVGLVLFDVNKEAPQFSIQVSPQRFSPDMFYVNAFADRLKLNASEKFEELFG